MPWCDDCDRFLNPNTVNDDGTCPECGAHITSPRHLHRSRQGRGPTADAMVIRAEKSGNGPTREATDPTVSESDTEPTTPWHFWVLVVALIIYLGWRLIQGIVWLAHRF